MEQTRARQCGQVIDLFVEHREGFGFDNVQQGLRRIVKLVKGKPKLVSALRYVQSVSVVVFVGQA